MNWHVLGFSGVRQIPNLHPLFVHFPIGLLPVTLLFYGMGILWSREDYLLAGRILLYLSGAAGTLTVWTGLRAQIAANEKIATMLMTHETVGKTIFACAIILIVWSFIGEHSRPKGGLLFLGLLAFANLLAMQNGDIGSRMVYIEGAGVKPAIPAIMGGQEENEPENEPAVPSGRS
jgi:uncharacterized membrane protein